MSDNEIKIVPPETDDEKALCEILGGVLSTDSIGVTTDLFDLGLTSLGALHLVTDAEKKGVKIDIVDIVEYRTVRGILEGLSKQQSEVTKEDYALSEERERKLPHPILPAWQRLDASNLHWPYMMSFDLEVDAKRLCDALNKAIANRSALSMILEKDETGQAFLRYDSSLTPHYEVQRLKETEFEEKRSCLLEPFEMYGSPLIHAGVFETEKRVYLFLDIHHMIMDGIALTLLCDDIEKAYNGEKMRQDTFCTWLAADHSCREREQSSAKYKESRERLKRFIEDDNTHVGFEPDISGGAPETTFVRLQRGITKAELCGLVKHLGVSESVFCMGLTSLVVGRVEGDGDFLGSTMYHNRDDEISRNAFGFLSLLIFVTIPVKKKSSVAVFFKDLKESWNDSIENIHATMDIMGECPKSFNALKAHLDAKEASGVSYLPSLGARMEETERAAAAQARQVIHYTEENDGGITPLLILDKASYSAEKIKAIQKEMETVIDRLVAVKDPETVTLEELLG